MIVRFLIVVALAFLMGCNALPGSLKRAVGDVDARVPSSERPQARPENTEPANIEAEPAVSPAQEQTETDVETPTPAPEKPDANATARAACVAKGGNYTRTKAGAFVCVTRTGDNGRVCTASSQCEGACLARSGTCSPVTPLIGCHDIVTDGGGMATVCID